MSTHHDCWPREESGLVIQTYKVWKMGLRMENGVGMLWKMGVGIVGNVMENGGH